MQTKQVVSRAVNGDYMIVGEENKKLSVSEVKQLISKGYELDLKRYLAYNTARVDQIVLYYLINSKKEDTIEQPVGYTVNNQGNGKIYIRLDGPMTKSEERLNRMNLRMMSDLLTYYMILNNLGIEGVGKVAELRLSTSPESQVSLKADFVGDIGVRTDITRFDMDSYYPTAYLADQLRNGKAIFNITRWDAYSMKGEGLYIPVSKTKVASAIKKAQQTFMNAINKINAQ